MEQPTVGVPEARVVQNYSPNALTCGLGEHKGTAEAFSQVGQQAHFENEEMEVNSPRKPVASKLGEKEGMVEVTGQGVEEKAKTTAQWKRLAREKGKNKSPCKNAQLLSSRSKRAGKLIFEGEPEFPQKKQRSVALADQNQLDERSAVAARQHRQEP